MVAAIMERKAGRLVLSRRVGEELVFFDRRGRELARVGLQRIGRGEVRLSMAMPDDVKVMRAELLPPAAAHGAREDQGV